MLALADLGEVAAKVIKERKDHYFAEYPLTSTWPISQGDVVREVGKLVGKDIAIEHKGVKEAADMLCKRLYKGEKPSADNRDIAERMILYYDRRGLRANPNTCEMLLGRAPTDWKIRVKEQVEGTLR